MNLFGYCHLTCVPVRAEASDSSEMVNQLLFGETFSIVDTFKNWKLIRGSLDNYEGFIDAKQFLAISAETFTTINLAEDKFPVKIISWVSDPSGYKTLILPASSMGAFRENILHLGNKEFRYGDALYIPEKTITGHSVLDVAQMFLNAPYLWGGRSITGIDCSGLVQNVFKNNGIRVPRDAVYQAGQGITINMISEAVPGDLAFFDNVSGEITHVGIIAEDGKIIHASGFVRIDSIDHNGIFDRVQKKYTHKLRLIKRIIQ